MPRVHLFDEAAKYQSCVSCKKKLNTYDFVVEQGEDWTSLNALLLWYFFDCLSILKGVG